MTSAMPRPTSGVMEGIAHLFPVRVYFEETDAGQMVYHANYLKFAERARTEMMRVNGLDHASLMAADNLVFTVHSADVKYLRQAKLDDELVVRTVVKGVGGASMDMGQSVYRTKDGEKGEPVADLKLRLAIVDQSGKPQRIPARLKEILERLSDEKG